MSLPSFPLFCRFELFRCFSSSLPLSSLSPPPPHTLSVAPLFIAMSSQGSAATKAFSCCHYNYSLHARTDSNGEVHGNSAASLCLHVRACVIRMCCYTQKSELFLPPALALHPPTPLIPLHRRCQPHLLCWAQAVSVEPQHPSAHSHMKRPYLLPPFDFHCSAVNGHGSVGHCWGAGSRWPQARHLDRPLLTRRPKLVSMLRTIFEAECSLSPTGEGILGKEQSLDVLKTSALNHIPTGWTLFVCVHELPRVRAFTVNLIMCDLHVVKVLLKNIIVYVWF